MLCCCVESEDYSRLRDGNTAVCFRAFCGVLVFAGHLHSLKSYRAFPDDEEPAEDTSSDFPNSARFITAFFTSVFLGYILGGFLTRWR